MTRRGWALLFVVATSCNFDAALSRYCQDNPNCRADAAVTVDSAPSAPDVTVDAGGTAPPPRFRICRTSADCEPSREFCSKGEVCVPISHCDVDTDCGPSSAGCVQMFDPGANTYRSVCACSDRGCRPNAAVCHTEDNICEPSCRTTRDCEAVGFFQRICESKSGRCVEAECLKNLDCASASRPRCDFFTKTCGPCLGVGDCAGRPDGLFECAPTGACVRPLMSTSSP